MKQTLYTKHDVEAIQADNASLESRIKDLQAEKEKLLQPKPNVDETIQAARQLQSAHDREQSAKRYKLLSAARMAQIINDTPPKDLQSALEAARTSVDETFQTSAWEEFNRTGSLSTSEVYHVTAQDYFITYATATIDFQTFGRAFISKPDKWQGQWSILLKKEPGKLTANGSNTRRYVAGKWFAAPQEETTDLTRAEFNQIKDNKPTFEQVCSFYDLGCQANINPDKKTGVIPIW